ncbi:Biotin carboxyl carrier protein of acetyl-CoA carboxylase [Spatholobus suberectus]|nr:Biotin carboxyl carrier protein of acetyl-CoA carboxylase [Spatholobus suberectus]
MSHMRSSLEKQVVVPIHNVRWNSKSGPFIRHLAYGQKHINSHTKGKNTLVSFAKTAEAINTSKSDASSNSTPQDSLEKKPLQNATFPNGFEALVLEVCDETEIAELKVKVGDFEMHIKRNIGATKAPLSNISPTTPPPIPSKPMDELAPATLPPTPPKSSPEKTNPFVNASKVKSPKLAALEASGTNTYVLVLSPTVGLFRRGRTVKGKKQPPICKEGDLIKEGQVIGYLDQFGTGLPIKSDVAGEVLKLLVEDGEPVGYGDPLIAVLPSFHDIK